MADSNGGCGLPKVLNVAEKNDAAKMLATVMSGRRFQKVNTCNFGFVSFIQKRQKKFDRVCGSFT